MTESNTKFEDIEKVVKDGEIKIATDMMLDLIEEFKTNIRRYVASGVLLESAVTKLKEIPFPDLETQDIISTYDSLTN